MRRASQRVTSWPSLPTNSTSGRSFYIQNLGWIPVDVTYKDSNPRGDFFGRYDYKMVMVQRGVGMRYRTSGGSKSINLLQTCSWWFWYDTYATLSVKQHPDIDEAGAKEQKMLKRWKK